MIPLSYFIRKYVGFIALMFISFITQESITPKCTPISDTSIPPTSQPPIPENPKKGKAKPKTAPATLGTIPIPANTDLKKKKEVVFDRKESYVTRDRGNNHVLQNKATPSSSKGERKTVGKMTTTYQPSKKGNQGQKVGPTSQSSAQAKLQIMQQLINSSPQAKALLLGSSASAVKPQPGFSEHLLSVKSTPDTRAAMFKEFLTLRYKNLPASVRKVHKAIIKKLEFNDKTHAHRDAEQYHEVDLRDKTNLPRHARIVRPRNSKITFYKSVSDDKFEVKLVGDEYCLFKNDAIVTFGQVQLLGEYDDVQPMDEGQPEVRFQPGNHMQDLADQMERMKKQVHTLTMKNGLARLENNEEFVMSMCYKSALTFLLPELFKNFGICDEFNTDSSCFPTIPTRYTVPFATIAGQANCCAMTVSMDPEEIIRVVAQGGDFSMLSSFMNNKSPNGQDDQWIFNNVASREDGVYRTPSYLIDTKTSLFYVNQMSLQINSGSFANDFVQLTNVRIAGSDYYYYPLDTGSTVLVYANTNDATVNGYSSVVSYITLTAGAYGLVEGSPVNGNGSATTHLAAFSHTPPANSVGIWAFTVANAAAGTTAFASCKVCFAINAAPSDIVVSCGSENSVDLDFIKQWTPDIRPVAVSNRGIAYCGALSQILAVYGQYLANEGDDDQAPVFQNYTANLRSKVKTLVGTSPGFFFPLLHKDYESINFYDISIPYAVDSPRNYEKGFIYLIATTSDGEFFVLENYLSLQTRPRPGLTAIDARPGVSCPEALSRVNNVLSREDLTFENPDHVAECMDIARETTATENNSSFNIDFSPTFSVGDISDIFI